MADIGEGIGHATIVEWFVLPGQKVQEFEKIADVRTDKAAVEITSPVDGIVKNIYFKQNEVVAVGQVMADFDVKDDD